MGLRPCRSPMTSRCEDCGARLGVRSSRDGPSRADLEVAADGLSDRAREQAWVPVFTLDPRRRRAECEGNSLTAMLRIGRDPVQKQHGLALPPADRDELPNCGRADEVIPSDPTAVLEALRVHPFRNGCLHGAV